MIFRLIYLNGSHKGERITVTREPMTIGRNASCGIHLPEDHEIADRHCTITHGENDELRIRDDGSMNRILVNSHEVTDSRLKHGDIIELGRTRLLVQAFVQADVTRNGVPTTQRRGSPLLPLGALLVLTACAVIGARAYRSRSHLDSSEAIGQEVIPPALFKDIQASEPTTGTPSPESLQTNATPAPETPAAPAPPKEPASASGQVTNPPPSTAKTDEQPDPQPPSVPAPIEIVSLSQQKFPLKDEYDEMRVATLEIKSTGGVIDNTKVAIRFDFYDRDLSTGDIIPARAIVPTKAMSVKDLASSGYETVTATYTVPKGLRNAPAANSGTTYYGVHVKVMYGGELVAEAAKPHTLLGRE